LIAEACRYSVGVALRLPEIKPNSTAKQPNSPSDRARLARVESEIEHQAFVHPNDPAWAEAKATMEMLEGDYEASLRILDRGLDAWPERTELEIYRAAVLVEKAGTLRREDLLPGVYENLSRIINTSSRFAPVALFNRAIVAEELFLFQRAQRDWHRYLELDRSGPWNREAARRLDMLLGPVRRSTAGDTKDSEDEIRSNPHNEITVEKRLEKAVMDWLPEITGIGSPDSEARQEQLHGLAVELEKHGGDRWLGDLVGGPQTDSWKRGVASLSRSMKLNLAGERSAADREAEHAIDAFDRAGNRAGALAARVEQLYALNRSYTVGRCLSAARGLEQSLARQGYTFYLIQFLIELGGCQSRADNLSIAERNLTRALELARLADYRGLELRALTVLANHHSFSGNFTAAWNESWEALSRYWTGEYGAVRGHSIYFNFSMTAEGLGYPELALAMEQEASWFAARTPNHLQAAEGLFREVALASRRAAWDDASAALVGAQKIITQLPDDDVKRRYQWLGRKALAEADFDQGKTADAVAILDEFGPRVLTEDLPYERFDYFRLRARASAAAGDLNSERDYLRNAVAASESAYRTLSNEGDRIRWRVQRGTVYRPLVERMLGNRGGARKALELWEAYLDRREEGVPGAERNRETGIPIEKLRAATLISFLWLETKVGIWVADDRGISFSWAPQTPRRISDLVRRFARECSDLEVPADEVSATGGALNRALFGDGGIASAAGRGREPHPTLIIEADGELGAAPFEALVEPNGKYVVESYAVIYSSGIRRFLMAPAARLLSSATALVVAAPAVSGVLVRQFPPIPDSRREGDSVVSAFSNATLLTGRDATLQATRATLASVELFHFAGHGITYDDDGALLLAHEQPGQEGSLLTTTELAGLNLSRCKLAVLAACSSGTGEKRGPVNPNSLVSGFLRAGVRRVIASRWPVDSAATLQLMEHFYGLLLEGRDVESALQEAQSQLRGSSARSSHPFFWAGFSAFGT
jgi:hypothetical protein